MLNADNLFKIVGKMGGMKFFPSDIDGRLGIAELLADMCDTEEQAIWLIKRMRDLFPGGWPGIGEMRAVYCSKFKPKDRIEANSEVFPLGVPSEVPGRDDLMAGFLPAASKRLQLASGEPERVSASPSIQSTMEVLREAKRLKNAGLPPVQVPSIPVVRVTDENRTTEADFEKVRQELREKRERGER